MTSTLQFLAEVVASDPAFFRTEQSREVLYRGLTSAEQIDAIYVSFEHGYHRVVTRIDDRRRRSDPRIPPSANWHSSYIDDFSVGKNRSRHRTFFDTWPHVVGEYAVPTDHDVRALPHYKAAKATRSRVVTDLGVNPDTGSPVLFVAYPIMRSGQYIGFACANITVDILPRFLDRHRASPHSRTTIVERGGAIIAYPDIAKQVRTVDGRLAVARVADIADDDLREAYRQRALFMGDDFVFRSPVTGQEQAASFDRFPASFPRPWETVILTPTDDFVGPLKAANRQTVAVIAVLIGLGLRDGGEPPPVQGQADRGPHVRGEARQAGRRWRRARDGLPARDVRCRAADLAFRDRGPGSPRQQGDDGDGEAGRTADRLRALWRS